MMFVEGNGGEEGECSTSWCRAALLLNEEPEVDTERAACNCCMDSKPE
jgi:hypothetical protein